MPFPRRGCRARNDHLFPVRSTVQRKNPGVTSRLGVTKDDQPVSLRIVYGAVLESRGGWQDRPHARRGGVDFRFASTPEILSWIRFCASEVRKNKDAKSAGERRKREFHD